MEINNSCRELFGGKVFKTNPSIWSGFYLTVVLPLKGNVSCKNFLFPWLAVSVSSC